MNDEPLFQQWDLYMIQMKESGYLMERLSDKKMSRIRKIAALAVIISICLNAKYSSQLMVKASETRDENVEKETVRSLELDRTNARLFEGLLDTPESFQRQAVLYEWITEAVNQYVLEKGIDDVFYCNLEEDLLSEKTQYIINNSSDKWKDYPYEYLIEDESKVDMGQGSYKLKLAGQDHILYVDVQVQDKKIYLYPAECEFLVVVDNSDGNIEAYEQIESGDDGQIVYYPDIYVKSDWDDLERIDDHFAGVTTEELEELEYLKLPKGASDSWNVVIYLDVASILKRYVEENQMDDVFYFDADKDIIARVTNMIFTCRLRSQERTLYMDIDSYNMNAHVYEVEEW